MTVVDSQVYIVQTRERYENRGNVQHTNLKRVYAIDRQVDKDERRTKNINKKVRLMDLKIG
nr:hypothetical protein MACL_00000302 [Theileria orientalis]